MHPFDSDGVWLRCQLHAHTTNSDGEATPAELCATYAGLGCDVLAITDHWFVTEHEHDGLLVLPCSELSARVDGPAGEAEILALGVAELPEVRADFPDLEQCAAWIAARGGVPYLCHPYWSGLGPEHWFSAPSLVGMEIYNAGSEIAQGNGLSTVHWDDVLLRGGRALAIATDDCHYPPRDSGHGWTMVRVAERTPAAVLDALRTGAGYASSGAELVAIDVEPGAVVVRCSPAQAVTLRSGPWDGCRVNADAATLDWRGAVLERDADGAITAARFEPLEYWQWGRVEVLAADGGRAWSNPFPCPGPAEPYFRDEPA
jgi:hypothetical protein